jgi:hypothetical protein
MTTMTNRPALTLALLVAACGVDPAELDEAPCPCTEGYVCCDGPDVCVRENASCAHLGQERWQVGIQHHSCADPVPDDLPPLPAINVDATGRPLFDYWRDLAPGDLPDLACTAATAADCPDGGCLVLDIGSGAGVCSAPDADRLCDGDGEAMGWGDGACFACVSLASHAFACDAGIEGVDCRAWPFPADGVPGAICGAHEDCEPGLVCGASDGGGYGVCQCPDLPSDPSPAPTCFPG